MIETNRPLSRPLARVATLLAGGVDAWGQTAVIQGNLMGFDVLNDTGQPSHGLEIQMEGTSGTVVALPAGRAPAPARS